MPAAKSLKQHVRDRTFRSRRHHTLLAGRALPLPWPSLCALQARNTAATHDLERRVIGVEFERAVRIFDEVLEGVMKLQGA